MLLPVIKSFGRSSFDPIWAQNEHVDDSSEMMHILSGRVEVRASDYSIRGRKGDTIFTPAGTPHRDVFSLDSPFEVYLIQFNWAGESELLRDYHPTQLVSPSRASRNEMSAQFHRLHREFTSDLPCNQEIAETILLEIIYGLKRQAAVASGHTEKTEENCGSLRRLQIMLQAKEYIQEKFSSPLTLETVSSALKISPYYLSRVFSEENGFTLSSYLTKVRMEHATRLLGDPLLNISEVALAVGYNDGSYFRQVFKSHFGVSPKAYKMRILRRKLQSAQ